MERSEPALIPEWLRSSGNVAGGGSSVHHQVSSSSHTDAALANHTRNRISKCSSDFDNPRAAHLERSSSSNSRRSSSNGSVKHAYSSFNRNHRDREKERSSFGDHWDHDSSNLFTTIFPGRMEKDNLRHSHSMISRKPSEVLSQRGSIDVKVSTSNSESNGNGILSSNSIGSSIQKAVFDKDFPSLGTEERPAVSDIVRVPSPVLCTAGQSLPVGSSALIGGEGWSSALAEVPATICGSSSGSLSVHHTVAVTSMPTSPSSTTALNMAEALTQAPSRARTAPPVSVKTHRLEELAIKQSRQLIPVTPTMPKASVFSSSEKSKPKITVKNADANVASRSGLQSPTSSHIGTQSVRIGNVKPEILVATGKLVVLKPRENGVSLASKDSVSPTNIGKGGSQSHLPQSVVPTHSRSPNNRNSSTERKAATLDSRSVPTPEKRALMSQVQSRNDFFNLIKKKTSNINSPSESGPVMSASMHNSNGVSRVVAIAPASPCAVENVTKVASNGDVHGHVHTLPVCSQDDITANVAIYPDEEEAAFLRSLGWEETSGEDEGLTEEEINNFVHQYMKLIPSLKLYRGMQPKLSKLSESWITNSGRASADLSSSNAESGM